MPFGLAAVILEIGVPYVVLSALFLLTATAIVIRRELKAGKEASKAMRQRRGIERVYQCSERLLSLDPAMDFVHRALEVYVSTFNLRAACFFEGRTAEMYACGAAGRLSVETRDAYIAGRDSDDLREGVTLRCIRTCGSLSGAIGFEGLPEPELVIRPLMTMTIAALDRTRAFQIASTAAAEARTEIFRTAVLDALAHEFKTPLAIILTAAGGLRDMAGSSAEQALAEEIESEASRLGELTSRLLQKADADSEEVQARMERIDLGSLVMSLVDRFARRNTDRNLSFQARGSESVEVAADPGLLGLAISQLLDNAVKYSSPASVIVASLEEEAESVGVRVWNSGSSILPADQARIFERFYRGTNAQSLLPGSGLGLYVARKIARAHGGTVVTGVHDASEGGTAFRLTLPRLQNGSEHTKDAN
jgi:two-component system, OmpR family, sensor histidine kinase KdpD